MFAGCSKTDDSSSQDQQSSTQATDFTFTPGDYLAEDGFFKDLDVNKYVTLGQYKGISVPAEIYTIADDEVNSQINAQMDYFATYEQLKTGTVAENSTVNIDYVGSVDGVEFEGGSTGGKGTTVTIGETNYIDGFLDQLVGHKVGETFDINVTFPEDYDKEDLKGKAAVFNITINYLQGEKIVPELTDDFVKENFANYGYQTVEDMQKDVKEQLATQAQQYYVWQQMLNSCTVTEIPEKVMEFQTNSMLAYYNQTAQQYGISLDEYISYNGGMTREEFIENSKESLEANVKEMLIMMAIAKAEGFEATEEVIKTFMNETYGTEDYSSYEETYGLPYIKFVVLQNNMINTVFDSAVRA